MEGENFRDIVAFIAVAKERSFTKAAAQLGVSQSALSHTIRGLETRLGLRLLTRTTRSVSPTEAGERLLERVAPRFDVIADELASLGELSKKLTGTVRIAASDYAFNTVIWPKLAKSLKKHPDIKLEVINDSGLTDIVADRFDAGIRFGHLVAKNMESVKISPDFKMMIVAAPTYLKLNSIPFSPTDLTNHSCINVRYSMHGGVSAWELAKDGKIHQIKSEGPLVFNSLYPVLDAALAGFGLAYLPENLVKSYLSSGQLQPVLYDWSPTNPGLHICYSSDRQLLPSLSFIIETLRYRD